MCGWMRTSNIGVNNEKQHSVAGGRGTFLCWTINQKQSWVVCWLLKIHVLSKLCFLHQPSASLIEIKKKKKMHFLHNFQTIFLNIFPIKNSLHSNSSQPVIYRCNVLVRNIFRFFDGIHTHYISRVLFRMLLVDYWTMLIETSFEFPNKYSFWEFLSSSVKIFHAAEYKKKKSFHLITCINYAVSVSKPSW